jgi:hypothetical protein
LSSASNTLPPLETGSLPSPDNNSGDVKSNAGKKPRGTAAVKIRLENLQPELEEKLVEYIGLPLAVISPLAAGVIDHRAERTARSLIRIAETSPRFRKALENFVKGSSATDLGLTAVAVFTAISVDRRNLAPEEMGMVATYFQLDEIYYQVYPHTQPEQNGNGANGVRPMGLGGEFA